MLRGWDDEILEGSSHTYFRLSDIICFKKLSLAMSETPAHNINSPHELREPRITLESDVVLAPETRRMFEEAIGAMRHHKTIYTDWGFGAVDPMGRNMIINLYGPPGTGKTSYAYGIAKKLGLTAYQLDVQGKESPVIFITGYEGDANVERAKQIGYVDYLYKPLDIKHFITSVKKQLQCSNV